MTSYPRLIAAVLAAGLLSHCGVKPPSPCQGVSRASREPATSLIEVADHSWRVLADPARRDDWPEARASYNTAVSGLFDKMRCGRGPWAARAAAIGTVIAPDVQATVDPVQLDALFPASLVNGNTLDERHETAGLGVPLVGWKATTPVGAERARYTPPNGIPYNITALLRFDRGRPAWSFEARWNTNTIATGPTRQTLAADWSAPNAFFWQMSELDDLKVRNVLLPERFTGETGLFFVTPYDPGKIPVVFIHGLVSSPDAFKNMINQLAPDPWFRANYQIWVYSYPTGNPWLYSSMVFREQMRAACAFARTKGDDRKLRQMVLVGHSMGGLLARSSVTDPGDAFHRSLFKRSFDPQQLPASTRRLIDGLTRYRPLEEPRRVVFLAVPHRGSPLASLGAVEWISRLIRLPKALTVDLLDATLLAVGDVFNGSDPARRPPTSINSLSPKDPATLALGSLPLPGRVKFHSILGDRGRGVAAGGGDGVVPYSSSHIAPVESECIVPAGHNVPDHPAACAELERILRLHLKGG